MRHDGNGAAEIAERERAATAAADAHYTRLHNAQHDPRTPYGKCERCKERGWR